MKTPTEKVHTPTHTDSLSLFLFLFTTLSEAGVEGPGPLQIEAICDWLQAQVDHLMEAELAAVNGRSFWFQSDEELLGTVGRHQTSLEEEKIWASLLLSLLLFFIIMQCFWLYWDIWWLNKRKKKNRENETY